MPSVLANELEMDARVRVVVGVGARLTDAVHELGELDIELAAIEPANEEVGVTV